MSYYFFGEISFKMSAIVNVQQNKEFIEKSIEFLLNNINSAKRSSALELFEKYKKLLYAVMYDIYSDGLDLESFDKRHTQDFRVGGTPYTVGVFVPLDDSQRERYRSIAESSQGLLPIGNEFDKCRDICEESYMFNRFHNIFY